MINRNTYVELKPNGILKLIKAGKHVKPVNRVLLIDGNTIYFETNNGPACMDIVDYLRHSYWAHRITYDHKGLGVLAYHNGVEHKSVPADIMGTHKAEGEFVGYKNGDRMDCRHTNLTVFYKEVTSE